MSSVGHFHDMRQILWLCKMFARSLRDSVMRITTFNNDNNNNNNNNISKNLTKSVLDYPSNAAIQTSLFDIVL